MSRTILVVDDEPDVADVVSTRLRARRWEVVHAPDGEQALALLDERPVDLVILDLMMPGMDGLAFLSRFRKQDEGRPPVLVMSAYGIPGIPEAALGLGADGYLAKPFTGAHLESTVESLLGEPPQAGRCAPTILVVDDDPEFHRQAEEELGRFGCRVKPAESFRAAVRLAQVERPDLLLIDVGLPEIQDHDARLGDGHTWNNKQMPVIMLADSDDPAHRNRARRLGADLLVSRPTRPDAWENFGQAVLRLSGRPGAF